MAKQRLTREARRNLILDAGTEVFGRLGFEATRMDDVAKAAGIAKGLLYKHFPSKDALFEALVDRQGLVYAAELRGALQAADLAADPFEALRSGLALWLRTVGDDKAAFNVTDPGIHDAYDGLRDRMREVVVEAIQSAEPEVQTVHARLLAALILGAAESLGMTWRRDPEGVTEDEALLLLAGFCWSGLSGLQTALLPAAPQPALSPPVPVSAAPAAAGRGGAGSTRPRARRPR